MTPPECDLRGYDYMPLFGHRLFTSRLNDKASDAEFRAALRIWWAAWQQCPAGSLPDDDAALARLADYGRDIKGWSKVREMAMHGFVLCSDGRLYHPMLCEAALKAYELKLKGDHKRDTDRKRLQDWRNTQRQRNGNGGGNAPETPVETLAETRFETPPETRFETRDETQMKRVGIERKGKRRAPPLAPPVPGGAKNRGRVSLPSDWLPNESQRSLAAGLGLDPDATALNFRDHCLAQAKRLGDPDAAWRVWCRVAASTSPSKKRRSNNGLLELHRRVEAGEDVVGSLLAEMEAERAKTH